MLTTLAVLGGVAAAVAFGPGSVGQVAGGPHRVPTDRAATPPAADAPQWDAPDHHWVGLTERWAVPQVDDSPRAYGLAADGERVFALRKELADPGSSSASATGPEPEAELTAYEATSGELLWRTSLHWIHRAVPTAAEGIVVVPSGQQEVGEQDDGAAPAEYVALDSVTGAERWRVRVEQRVAFPGNAPGAGNAPGVFLDGVFYYADGPTVFGIDAATGDVRHEVTSERNVVVAGPVVSAGRIAVIAAPPFDPTAPSYVRTAYLFTPDLADQISSDFPEHAEPDSLAASGDVLVTWGAGVVWATDARTGHGLWSIELPELTEPVGTVGKVVVARDARDKGQNKILGYDLLTGEKVWTAAPPNDSGFASEPVNVGIADGTVFAMAHGISIVDARTGEIGYRHPTVRAGGLATAAAGHIVIYNHDGITGFE